MFERAHSSWLSPILRSFTHGYVWLNLRSVSKRRPTQAKELWHLRQLNASKCILTRYPRCLFVVSVFECLVYVFQLSISIRRGTFEEICLNCVQECCMKKCCVTNRLVHCGPCKALNLSGDILWTPCVTCRFSQKLEKCASLAFMKSKSGCST